MSPYTNLLPEKLCILQVIKLCFTLIPPFQAFAIQLKGYRCIIRKEKGNDIILIRYKNVCPVTNPNLKKGIYSCPDFIRESKLRHR